MPELEIKVDDRRALARVDALLPGIRAALVEALGPVAQAMATDARQIALDHIRYEGTKPGQYLASIYGGTFDKSSIVGGFVRSGNPLAHLLEYGATVPPHEIMPKAGNVLAFEGDAGAVFARHVSSPGATIPAYPAITPAFAAARDALEAAMRGVIEGADRA